MKKKSILIIDDHPLIRRGVTQLLSLDPEFEVVGEAGNGTDGVALAMAKSPDMIILDLNMKGMSGLDVLKALRAEGVDAFIVILTVSNARADIIALMDAGADGYLLKDTDPEELLSQIRRVFNGEVILSDAAKERLVKQHSDDNPFKILTERELGVLKLIAKGLSNKQIANQLYISEETVKVHIRNILRKLKVHSRVAATILYLQQQEG